MLQKRTVVAAVLLPIAFTAIYLGGYIFAGMVILLLVIAALEYTQLLKKINLAPSLPTVLLGVLILTVFRTVFEFTHAPLLITGVVLLAAVIHMVSFEKKPALQAADFGATLSVTFYIGWLGAYLISLRDLTGGLWWTLWILPTVWVADTAAYLVGTTIGKRPLSPNTSPNKTWEGYLGSVISGAAFSYGLLLLYTGVFQLDIQLHPIAGAIVGMIISAVIPLGDLIGSMVKRQASVKDSGNLFPGHGGAFDRLDSLFWAAPLGFYLIQLLLN